VSCRALPIRFQEVSVVKRPRRNASEQLWKQYRLAQKQHNLSQAFVEMMGQLRPALDQAGGQSQTLVVAGDGSFCNRTCFTASVERTVLIARARKDAVLCWGAPEQSRRFYAVEKFTPQQVRQDESIPWKEATPYRKRKSGRLYYRQPAYLLTTDLVSPAKSLLQIYFDRWQIEVNHREEQDTLGVGQAQLWNPTSGAQTAGPGRGCLWVWRVLGCKFAAAGVSTFRRGIVTPAPMAA